VPDSEVRAFQGATRLRCIDFDAPLEVTQIPFPMNLCLCWDQLTHIDFSEMSIQVSIAHEVMKLCVNLRECRIRLESNCNTLHPVWIESHTPSGIRVPYLWILEIDQEAEEEYVTRVCLTNSFGRWSCRTFDVSTFLYKRSKYCSDSH